MRPAIGNRRSAIGKTLLAGCLVLAAACTDTGSGPNARTTQVLLTDSPFPYEDIARVEVYIHSVDASADADTASAGQTWTPIAQPLQAFDLLQLQRGSTVLLGNADLPAGNFRAIRMVIDPSQSRIVRIDGSIASVQWPQTPGGLITMHALVEEPLATGPGARIVIDFDVGRSFLVLESFPTQFVFSPWIRAVNDAATGTLSGQVDWSNSIEGPAGFGGNGGVLPGASVTLFRGNPLHEATWWVAASARADAQGRYLVAYLRDADYIVRIQGTTPEGYGCNQFTGITVERQATTTLNAIVFPYDACVGPDPDPNDTSRVDTTVTSPGGPVASVTVRAWLPPAGLTAGDSVAAFAELVNAQGAILSGRQVTWSLSDSSVFELQATFGHYTHLRALRGGTATLTATSEGRSGSLALNVGGATVPDGVIDTVRLTPNGGAVRVGDTLGIIALTYDFPATVPCPTAIAWSVDDATVFQLTHTINNYAVVRALRAGATIVRGACGSRAGAAYYSAWTDTTTGGGGGGGAVASVSVGIWPASPAVNDSVGAYATLTNAAGQTLTGRAVTWTVSDTTVLRVTGTFGQSFLMRALRAGTATVTAVSEGRTGSASVTVH